MNQMSDEFYKVINVQILTLATRDGVPDQRTRPLLRYELENGDEFMMSGIPNDIALSLSMELNDIEPKDSRLQIQDIVGELALVEKVEVDIVVPQTTVYQSTVYLIPEGFERSVSFAMVPSHATLLAVLNDAPIYVSRQLVEQSKQM